MPSLLVDVAQAGVCNMKNYWLGDWPKEEVVKDENKDKEIETPHPEYIVIWAGHKVEIPN
jgi:hypothetical protein